MTHRDSELQMYQLSAISDQDIFEHGKQLCIPTYTSVETIYLTLYKTISSEYSL